MSLIPDNLMEKMERASKAARELEAALNDLVSSNFMDKVQAEIDVVESQQIQNIKPKQIFCVRVGGTVQWHDVGRRAMR
ncbi:hypothetical protein [Comamonas sp. 4034]|uniref:hypothetical protein n=1 Tax=Comamonas sp. 4034 TaxID=3156455 RepID=UPI003D25EA24